MEWWKEAVFYQIYPRSFADSNGDGIGDLPGIRGRLPYLQQLGVDALWISPFFPSPMKDFGYDVSDYEGVDPLFGTLDDFDRLLAEAHRLGLKVVIDYVPNHSSDQHPWFLESRSNRSNPKRDWYTWRDPKPDGSPPNNWLSRFDGKSAWEFDAATGQYYLHTFLKEQPDLNWRNPEVRERMLDSLRFWLRRGVDGFRIDVAHRVLKDTEFRDNPPDPEWRAGGDPARRLLETFSKDQADAHEFNRWLRAVIDEFDDRVLIGEIWLPCRDLVRYYGNGDEFHIPFNFALIKAAWDGREIAALAEEYEACLPADGWPNWVLGCHDKSRIATRAGAGQARAAMMMLLTLRGTPTIYYGDELGMEDVPIPPELVQDPHEKNVPGLGLGRDPERTPMQWDGSPNAGFCPAGVNPWLPIAADAAAVNVAVEEQDAGSMLRFTHELLSLRRREAALRRGDFKLHHGAPELLAFSRTLGKETLLVVLSLSSKPQRLPLAAVEKAAGLVLETSPGAARLEADEIRLAGNGGGIFRAALTALALLIVSVALLVSPASAAPTIDGFVDCNCDRRLRIVFLGDSITWGRGDTWNAGGYPLRMRQAYPGTSMVNLGENAMSTMRMFQHLKRNRYLKLPKDDIVTLMIGINDWWENGTPGRTVRNIKRIVELLRTRASKDGYVPFIAVSTLTPTHRSFLVDYQHQVNALLLRYRSAKLPVYIRADVLDPGLIGESGVHPTPQGYDQLTNIFDRALHGEVKQHMMYSCQCPVEDPQASPTKAGRN